MQRREYPLRSVTFPITTLHAPPGGDTTEGKSLHGIRKTVQQNLRSKNSASFITGPLATCTTQWPTSAALNPSNPQPKAARRKQTTLTGTGTTPDLEVELLWSQLPLPQGTCTAHHLGEPLLTGLLSVSLLLQGFNPGLSSSLLPTDILSVPVLLAPLAMPSRLVTLLLGGGTTRRGVAAGTCRFGTR